MALQTQTDNEQTWAAMQLSRFCAGDGTRSFALEQCLGTHGARALRRKIKHFQSC